MTRKIDNSEALSAFVARKAEFDDLLAKLQAASNDHFSTDPDTLHWGDVGSLSAAVSKLREVVEFANA